MNPGGSDLVITVGGDLTPLETALNQIPQVAEQAFGQVQSAIQSVDWSGVTTGAEGANAAIASIADTSKTAETDLGNLATSVSDASDAAASAVGEVGDLADAASTLSDKSGEVVAVLPEVASDVNDVGESAQEASGGLNDMAEQLLEFGEALAVTEGLKELGQEALTTFGNVEKATISLTALTGSAETANTTIETLKGLAISDALAFPSLVQAAQKMTALKFSTDQMNTTLQTAADAAAATGNDFGAVANAIDRMASTGLAAGRQLLTLGINTKDLGDAMGVTADEATKAFKALGDQGSRLEVLSDAMSKFDGVATQVAQGIAGQWQNLKTQFEFVMEGIGAALAPVISQMLNFASSTIVPAIQKMVDWFNQLPTPIKDVAIGLVLVAGAAAPLAVAIGGFGLAVSGLGLAVPAIKAIGDAFLLLATDSIPAAVAAIRNVVLAISEGLVGALTDGEALLVKFAAAGALVAAAFVFYDQIKQLAANLSNLNDVMNAGIPGWKDFKDAIASVADAVGGAIVSSFKALLDVLGPVGSAIKSIGDYLPSFSGMWNDVKNAIAGIHWSDLIGPIGALNSALKAMAEAIELVTGKYPSMQAAGTSALNAIQSANDKLNDSLAKQAGGFTALAPAQAAYTAAHQASAAAVTAHATAADALAPAVTNVGTAAAFVGPKVSMLADAHNAAATAATNQAIKTGALGGTLETLAGTQVWTAAKSVTDLVGCMDDAATATTDFTGKISDAGNVTADFVRSIGGLQTVGEGATGTISGLGDAVQTVTPDLTAAQAALDGVASSEADVAANAPDAVSGLNAVAAAATSAADAAFQLDNSLSSPIGGGSGKGKGGGGLQVSITPNMIMSTAPQGIAPLGGLTGPIGGGNSTTSQDPFLVMHQILDSTATMSAVTKDTATAVASLGTAATVATTTTAAMTAAIQQVTDANALEQQAAQASGTAAYSALKAVADAAANAAATALASAQGTTAATAATNTNTAATVASTAAMNALNTATATVSQGAIAAATSIAMIGTATEPFVAYLTGIGHILGVGGSTNLAGLPSIGSPTGSYVVPSGGASQGVGGPNSALNTGFQSTVGGTGPSVNLNINLAGSVLTGANGMQQLTQQISAAMVNELARRGIRMTRG